MKLGSHTFWASSIVSCLFFAASTYGTTVAGTASVAGISTITSNSINFAPGTVQGGTGSFAGATGLTIGSLSKGPFTGPVSIVDFATFTGASGFTPIYFDLTYIQPGTGTNAACNGTGGACTPLGSPFTLTQEPQSVLLTLDLNGLAYTGSSAASKPIATDFVSNVVYEGLTIPEVLAIAGSGQSLTGSYSGTFSTAPEPASILLTGFGVLSTALIARRKTRHKQNRPHPKTQSQH